LLNFNHTQLDHNPFEADKKYDAFVLAVAHHQFLELSREDYEKISNGELVLIDVKSVSKDASWRL